MVYVPKKLGYQVGKKPEVAAAIEATAKEILATAQGLAQSHRVSGRYQKSLKARKSTKFGQPDWIVFSNDPEAVIIEYGAGPHMIGNRKHPGMDGLMILNRAAGAAEVTDA